MSTIRLTIDLPRGTAATALYAVIRGLGCSLRLSRDGSLHAAPDEQAQGGIVVCGPQGCGKSKLASLLERDGNTEIVDEWDGKTPLKPGQIALTNVEPPCCVPDGEIARFTARSESAPPSKSKHAPTTSSMPYTHGTPQ